VRKIYMHPLVPATLYITTRHQIYRKHITDTCTASYSTFSYIPTMGQVLSFVSTSQSKATNTTTSMPVPTGALLSREEFLKQLHTYRPSPPQPLKADTVKQDGDSKERCCICWVDISNDPEEGELPVLLHGTHLVGEGCIRDWLSQGDNNACPVCFTVVCEKPLDLDWTIGSTHGILGRQPTIDDPISDRYILCCSSHLLGLAEDVSDKSPIAAGRLRRLASDLLNKRLEWFGEDPRLVSVDTTEVYKSQCDLKGYASATLSFHAIEKAVSRFHQEHFQAGLERISAYLPGSPALDPDMSRLENRILAVAQRLDGQTVTCDKFMREFEDVAPRRLLPPLQYRLNVVYLNRYFHDMVYIAMRACGAE